jgi:hypothetical protein
VNRPLARALRSAGLKPIDVAAQLAVDPKTVQCWLSGRKPYPRHRKALAKLTGWSLRDLWPELAPPVDPALRNDEIQIMYANRSAVPSDAWSRMFATAERQIGILAYSANFLAEDMTATAILRAKANAGVQIRLALGQPDGIHILARGSEEHIGDGMTARIRTALVGFGPVIDAGGELRLHDTVLYNSIYRADDQMLVNTHIFGHPASHCPVFHLRQRGEDGMAETYRSSFDRIWATATKSINKP